MTMAGADLESGVTEGDITKGLALWDVVGTRLQLWAWRLVGHGQWG